MIVVDNSILVPAFVNSADSEAARRVVAVDARWILPPLWQFEFTNAMVTLVSAKVLDAHAAQQALIEARVAIASREVPVAQSAVLQLASSLKLSGYDAQYIVLAREYGTRCVTADRQLAKRAPHYAILLKDFIQ